MPQDAPRDDHVSKSMLRIKSMKNMSFGPGKHSLSRLKVRRSSYGFGSIRGIGPMTASSQSGFEVRRPPLLFFPTYRIDPENPFNVEKVQVMLVNKVNETFVGHKYNPQQSPALAMKLSAELLNEMHDFDFDRYRFITVVTVVQRRAQCYNNAISFLWDHERDGYCDYVMENLTCFIQATIFAIYLD